MRDSEIEARREMVGILQKLVDDYYENPGDYEGVGFSSGVSFEDFNNKIAEISTLFASGLGAGASFKTFLSRLTLASDEAEQAMRGLGIITAKEIYTMVKFNRVTVLDEKEKSFAKEQAVSAWNEMQNKFVGIALEPEILRIIETAISIGMLRLKSKARYPASIALIAEERQRQITEEGWDKEHDDRHDGGELARAAACYATPAYMREFGKHDNAVDDAPKGWPWGKEWWKPNRDDRIRELVKAGALIAAEIDRLQRQSQ